MEFFFTICVIRRSRASSSLLTIALRKSELQHEFVTEYSLFVPRNSFDLKAFPNIFRQFNYAMTMKQSSMTKGKLSSPHKHSSSHALSRFLSIWFVFPRNHLFSKMACGILRTTITCVRYAESKALWNLLPTFVENRNSLHSNTFGYWLSPCPDM